jgi:polyadenylate-binding protein
MNIGYPFGNMPMMNANFNNVGKLSLAPALYVGDLDETIQEEQLYDFFTRYGPIHFVRIMRDSASGKSRGYGFVNFIHPRDAEAAKQYGQFEKLGRKHIRIMFKRNVKELPSDANIYVKNIDPNVNVKDLYSHFLPIGAILCCKIATDSYGQSLGYGYVQYEKAEDAKTALSTLQASKLKETELNLTEFVPKDKRNSHDEKRNLYVKNLPNNKNEAELDQIITDVFSKYGEIQMKLLKKHPTDNKYSAFVCFAENDVAQKCYDAIAANPPTLPDADGPIYLNWHQGKSDRQRELKRAYSHAPNDSNLYLKNLKTDITEQDIKSVFQHYGKITSIGVREWKSPNGEKIAKYGFIAFDNPEDAKHAQSEGLKNQDIRGLYLANAIPYINIHQSREKRNEYLNSLRRRYMQSNFMDVMRPMPMQFPNRRFQPYPMMYNQYNQPNQYKPQYPNKMGPRNFGGPKPWVNKGGPITQKPHPKSQQQSKPEKQTTKPTTTGKTTTTSQEASNPQARITVQSLRNKLNEFIELEDDKQRQILGELLYPLIKDQAGENLAPKITGMLIDLSVLEVSEILEFLEDPKLLEERVAEAVILLTGENA